MSIRDLAARHFRRFCNDTTTGFGWPVEIVAPDGTREPLNGFSTDIAQLVDPETGVAVSGRRASVTFPLSDVFGAFGVLPKRVVGRNEKPWLVEFADIEGSPHRFKVEGSDPDRTLGTLVLMLGAWSDAPN